MPRRGFGLLKRTLLAWDFVTAIVLSVALLSVLTVTDKDLVANGSVSGIAITYGVAIAMVNLVSLRWVSDRMKQSPYGELVRTIDPDESVVTLPYWIVAMAGLITSALGILGFVTGEEFPHLTSIALQTAVFFFGNYSLLGTVSLVGVTIRHQRLSAQLQSEKEATERRAREARRREERPDERGEA